MKNVKEINKEKQKNVYVVYKTLFIFRIFFISIFILLVLLLINAFLEPFLPAFQFGRDGSIAMKLAVSKNLIAFLSILVITIIMTILLCIVTPRFRKKYQNIIEYWNLGSF